jgi:hypothetical protein
MHFLQSLLIALIAFLIGLYSPLFSGRSEYVLSQQVIGPFIVVAILGIGIAASLIVHDRNEWREIIRPVINMVGPELASGESISTARFQELLDKILLRT